MKAELNVYKYQASKEIREIVNQEVLIKLTKYEKVANGFAKFLDTDELVQILFKLDKEEVNEDGEVLEVASSERIMKKFLHILEDNEKKRKERIERNESKEKIESEELKKKN